MAGPEVHGLLSSIESLWPPLPPRAFLIQRSPRGWGLIQPALFQFLEACLLGKKVR